MKRAASGFAWSTAEVWLRQLIQAVSFVVLARMLGPEAWGLFGIALIFILAAKVLIAEGGWGQALVRTPELTPDLLDTVFWGALGTASVLALLTVLGANAIADWFNEPEIAPILCWIALTAPLEALGLVPRALLVRELAFRPIAARSVLGIAAAGLAGVGAALGGAGVWSFVAYHLAHSLVGTIVLWRASPWRPGLGPSLAALRRVAAFVGQVFGERSLFLVEIALPRIVLGQVAGPVALGYYTFARKILDLASQLAVLPFSRVALPSFAALQADRVRLEHALLFGIRISAAISLPMFLGILLVVDDLLPLVLGAHWAPAVFYVQLAMLLGPAMSLTMPLSSLLLALGRGREIFLLTALGTALLICLLLALPEPDVASVLAVVIVLAYALLPLRLAAAVRATGISWTLIVRRIAPVVGAALALALVVLGVRASTFDLLSVVPRVAFEVIAGMAAYLVVLALADRELVGFIRRAAGSFVAKPASERRRTPALEGGNGAPAREAGFARGEHLP